MPRRSSLSAVARPAFAQALSRIAASDRRSTESVACPRSTTHTGRGRRLLLSAAPVLIVLSISAPWFRTTSRALSAFVVDWQPGFHGNRSVRLGGWIERGATFLPNESRPFAGVGAS